MAKLGVNIDHVATLRQARGTSYPDPLEAARMCERAGADGITVHLREDRRHIQDRDVLLLKETLQTRLNLEMAVTEEMLSFAQRVVPAYACFVPEKREELTTEGGLDVKRHSTQIKEAVTRLHEKRIQVSLFIDPDPQQIEASKAVGATLVELHTGTYCNARGDAKKKELDTVFSAISHVKSLGMVCNAGHGLDVTNILPLAQHPDIYEFNIGHSIICRAVMVGLDRAVREMATLLKGRG